MIMELIVREIIYLITEAEQNKKGKREAESIRIERKCYEDIKKLIAPLKGVIK